MVLVGKYTKLYVLSVLVLFISFALNGLGVLTTEQFVRNFKDSEALVTSQVKCEGKLYGGQLLNAKEGAPKGTCDPNNYDPYSSQYGIQGKIYTIGYRMLKKITGIWPSAYIAGAQLVTALLSAAVLAAVVIWSRDRLGKIPAIVVLIAVALSPMIVGFSRNLYWAMPLMFIPIVYVLYYFNPNQLRRGGGGWVFFTVLGLLLYVRYLTGYEYLTTFTILPFAVMVYFLYMHSEPLKSYVKAALGVGLVSGAAFAMALGTHVISLNSQTGSTKQSVEIIKKRMNERTTSSEKYSRYAYYGLNATESDVYQITNTYIDYDSRMEGGSILLATMVSWFNYALLPVVNVPVTFNSPFGLISQSLASLVVLLIAIFTFRHKLGLKKQKLRQMTGLYLSLVIGFAGFFSWLVAAHAHSLVHAHINGILFYLPFALIGFMIIGLTLEAALGKYARKTKK